MNPQTNGGKSTAQSKGRLRLHIKEGEDLPTQSGINAQHTHMFVQVSVGELRFVSKLLPLAPNGTWDEILDFEVLTAQQLSIELHTVQTNDPSKTPPTNITQCAAFHNIEIDQVPEVHEVGCWIPLDPCGKLHTLLTTTSVRTPIPLPEQTMARQPSNSQQHASTPEPNSESPIPGFSRGSNAFDVQSTTSIAHRSTASQRESAQPQSIYPTPSAVDRRPSVTEAELAHASRLRERLDQLAAPTQKSPVTSPQPSPHPQRSILSQPPPTAQNVIQPTIISQQPPPPPPQPHPVQSHSSYPNYNYNTMTVPTTITSRQPSPQTRQQNNNGEAVDINALKDLLLEHMKQMEELKQAISDRTASNLTSTTADRPNSAKTNADRSVFRNSGGLIRAKQVNTNAWGSNRTSGVNTPNETPTYNNIPGVPYTIPYGASYVSAAPPPPPPFVAPYGAPYYYQYPPPPPQTYAYSAPNSQRTSPSYSRGMEHAESLTDIPTDRTSRLRDRLERLNNEAARLRKERRSLFSAQTVYDEAAGKSQQRQPTPSNGFNEYYNNQRERSIIRYQKHDTTQNPADDQSNRLMTLRSQLKAKRAMNDQHYLTAEERQQRERALQQQLDDLLAELPLLGPNPGPSINGTSPWRQADTQKTSSKPTSSKFVYHKRAAAKYAYPENINDGWGDRIAEQMLNAAAYEPQQYIQPGY